MAEEITLSIIKPDAVSRGHIGAILSRFEKSGLRIVGAKMVKLSEEEARAFYAIHEGRPFFNDLVKFMISGSVLVSALKGEDAIRKHRDLMGATDPAQATPGTIRADFAKTIDANAVHGSDGPDVARTEIAFFFSCRELHS